MENEMNVLEWVSLAVICFMGAATPGPSLAIIINHTVKSGKKAGQIASFTHAFAIVLYAIATIYGLANIFQSYPDIANIITYAGVAYLLFLAYKLVLSSLEQPSNATFANQSVVTETNLASATAYKEAAQDAFLIAFLNPKLAFFFLALFSQFIPADSISIETTLILTSTVFFIDFFWYLIVVALITHGKSKLNISPNIGRWFARTQAAIFVLISINTILWR